MTVCSGETEALADQPSPTDAGLSGILVADCDPDRPDYGGTSYAARSELGWSGVRDGIPALLTALDRAEGDLRESISCVWCVRSDMQMAQIYGDAAWPYRQFEELWRAAAEMGSTIAWHPHLWRWSDEHGCWYQETEDEDWIEECLRIGHQALCEAVGTPVRVSRMGWEFHNDVTMRVIDELGVELDISAVPGRRRDAVSDRGSVKHGQLDWTGTPNKAYRPSMSDYRRAARIGEDRLEVMELPRTAMRSGAWGVVRWGWRSARAVARREWQALPAASSIASYVHAPPATAPPRAFAPLVRAWVRELHSRDEAGPLVATFHPDELLSGESAGYGLGNMLANLRLVAGAIRALPSYGSARLAVVQQNLHAQDVLDAMRREVEPRQ